MKNMEKEYGIYADTFDNLLDVFKKIDTKETPDKVLIIKLSNDETIEFKTIEEIKHKQYPAKEENKWFIYFKDLE